MKTFKVFSILIISFLFLSCSKSDDETPIAVSLMNLKIENTGTDSIEKVTVQTVDQIITLNQFAINSPTNYYLISNLNISSASTVTIENTLGTTVTLIVNFGAAGNYKLDIAASSDLLNYSVQLNLE